MQTAISAHATDPPLSFDNDHLRDAYTALQAWKAAIFSDPLNFTSDWNGADVCSYTGVFCTQSPSHRSPFKVVAGLDLNHGDIAGYLPDELGLLTDLALFHINSNRFCGIIPRSFRRLKLLFELDVSNNRLVGPFPKVVLSLPSLKYLDLRFNEFEGPIPSQLFDKDLDAIFVNDNRFRFGIPANLGNSPVSAMVLANNDLGGCIPSSIGKMGETLNEILLLNNNLSGCIPPEIGQLKKVTVFDVGSNQLGGPLPASVGGMKSAEQLNVAHNRLTGVIPSSICQLKRLENFTYSYNYFTGGAPQCLNANRVATDSKKNCIPGFPAQRSFKECAATPFVDCSKESAKCRASQSPSPVVGRPPSTTASYFINISVDKAVSSPIAATQG
ncbi:Leucine-rich repeat extensin-like protein 2 [Asimina triloba]